MKKFYDVCTKEEYMKGEQKVTRWHQVGKLMETDDGKLFLNMPLLPRLYVFEQREKNDAHKSAAKASEPEFQDDKIPF